MDGDCDCPEGGCEGRYEWPDGGHYEGVFKNGNFTASAAPFYCQPKGKPYSCTALQLQRS